MFPIPLMDQILNNGRGRGAGGSNPGLPLLGQSADATGGSGADQTMGAKYSCNRCGRSYQHQATLVRHQRYECGIQASYPCDICNRKFKRRDVLKGHKEKCVNKVQAQAALASMAGAAAVVAASGGGGTPPAGHSVTIADVGGSLGGDTTPIRAMSPPSDNSSGGFRPELHHTF